MKISALLVALVMASITATAQTESTTTSATSTGVDAAASAASAPAADHSTAAAPEKKAAPAKKAKAKKAKKAAKPSAKADVSATEKMVASTETLNSDSNATRTVATSDIRSTQGGPAANTSTTSATAAAAPAKKWGVRAQVYSIADYKNTQNIQNLTTLGGSYKVLPKLTIKASQTFETLTNGRDTSDETRALTKDSNFRRAYTDVTFASSLPAIAGSNELPISLNWRNMGGSDSDYTTIGGYKSALNFYEANFSVPYTLSSKFDLSIDTQIRHVVSRLGPSANSNRFLAIPSLSYTINDFVSVYQSAGMIWSFRDGNDIRRRYERVYLETGISLSPIKNLSVSFNINQDKAVYVAPSSGEDVSGFSLYKPTASAVAEDQSFDDVSIESLIAYTF